MKDETRASKLGLPPRPFLYTVDQICGCIQVQESAIGKYLYYEGRSSGQKLQGEMLARNIAPLNEKPEWRVAEMEFLRWLRFKGYRIYESAAVKF